MDEVTNQSQAAIQEPQVTVQTLLENCRHLGIPHFQRGMVWNDSNVALLLESLYFNTPCGSIVLWENPDKNQTKNFGIPLIPSENNIDYFLIDGQQRTRSLYSVFSSIFNSQMEQNDSEDIPYIWAVNLAQFEIVQNDGKKKEKPIFATNKKTPQEQFVKIQDPYRKKIKWLEKEAGKKKKSPEYAYQYNYVPLKFFFSKDENGRVIATPTTFEHKDLCVREDCEDPNYSISKQTVFVKYSKDFNKEKVAEFLHKLKNALADILQRILLVRILNTKDMSDVIHTFIRINGGGRPVQEEEKTLARLVELCPEKIEKDDSPDPEKGTFAIINDLFNAVHPEKDSTGNEHLQRMKENQFGFKLFIRVFVIAANYHSGWAVGSQSMSFSVIHENEQLKEQDENIRKIWNCVKATVLATKDLLENELKFDTLVFLPDTRSLWPIFLLLIKYPGVIEDGNKISSAYRNHFAYIALNLLLGAGDSEKDIMQFMKAIRNSPLDGVAILKVLTSNLLETDNIGSIQKVLNSTPSEPTDTNNSSEQESAQTKDAATELEKNTQNLLKSWNKIRDANTKVNLKGRLKDANTTTNRYVLLLYALERHLGAEDFYGPSLCIKDKENQRDPMKLSRFTKGRKIQANMVWCTEKYEKESNPPEKQHIVPYVCLHGGNEDSMYKGRISKDPANNIGNITYISHELNHYETGIGEYWLNLSEADDSLKKWHILSEEALKKYNDLEKKDYDKEQKKSISPNGVFNDWIKQRQTDIAQAFCKWIGDLSETIKKGDNLNWKKDPVPHAKQIIEPQDEKYSFDSVMGYIWEMPPEQLTPEGKLVLCAVMHNKPKCFIQNEEFTINGTITDYKKFLSSTEPQVHDNSISKD